MGYNVLGSFAAQIPSLVGKYLRSVSVTLNEVSTSEGSRFNHTFDVELSNGETKYFLYNMPEGGNTVALQKRIFKSYNGAVDLKVLWDVAHVEGVHEDVFNEYNKYDGDDLETIQISECTVPNDSTARIRESDFLTSSGQGSNSSGDVSSDSGYRLYEPGSYFIAKITNLENSTNRVLLGYSFLELTSSVLVL